MNEKAQDSNRPALQIDIISVPGSGKSAAVRIISDALSDCGAVIHVVEPPGEAPQFSTRKLYSVLNGRTITVRTITPNKEASS